LDANHPDNYLSLSRTGKSEYVINKSVFFGYAKSTLTEDDALNFINEISELHPESSCICYGYMCGYSNQIQKYHDGHEPVGGKPILSAIKLKNLISTTCVVARYFGGTKLGVGGLARAFSSTASSALDNGQPSLFELGKELVITYDYLHDGKIAYLLENSKLEIDKKEYLDKISITIKIKNQYLDEFKAKLNTITSNNHTMTIAQEMYMC